MASGSVLMLGANAALLRVRPEDLEQNLRLQSRPHCFVKDYYHPTWMDFVRMAMILANEKNILDTRDDLAGSASFGSEE